MTIAYRIAEKRVAALEEELESWPADLLESECLREVEEVVSETDELFGSIRRLARTLGPESLARAEVDDIVATHHVGYLIQKSLGLFTRVSRTAAESRRSGHEIESLSRLEESAAEMRRLFETIRSNWKLPDEQTVLQSKEEFRQGQYHEL